MSLLVEKPSQKRLEIALDMLRIDNKNFSVNRLINFLLENYVKESHAIIAELLDDDTVTRNSKDDYESWNENMICLVVSGIVTPDSLDDFDRWFNIAEEIEWDLEDRRTQYAEKRLRTVANDAFDFGEDEDYDDDFDDDDDNEADDGIKNSIPSPSFPVLRDYLEKHYETDDSDSDDGYTPPQPYRKIEPDIGRNAPCPCGSGKKYKKCCMNS
jgi:predicted transcriptional regulator